MGTPANQGLENAEPESWRLLDSIPGPIVTLTKTGEVEKVNRYLFEYLGTTMEKIRNWATNDLIHPEDLPHLRELFNGSISTGTPFGSDQRLLGRDGVYRWFQARALPLLGAGDEIVRWCVLLTDVDERKRAENALLAREHNLQLIIDTIPALAWSANVDGSADFLNRHYLEFTGLSGEQAKGWDWTVAIHPEDLGGLATAWQRILASERPGEAEARIRRVDGVYRWHLFRVNPFRDESGKIVKWYGTNLDIDDRKRAEQALQNTQVYLSEGERLGHMGSWALNSAGFDYWSPGLRRVYGLDPGGEPPTMEEYLTFAHPDDREFLETGVEKMFAGHLGFDFTKRIVRSSGEIRYVRLVGVPVVDGSTFKGFVGTGIDVTEQEQLLQKLRQGEQDLRTLIDTIRQIIVVLAPDGTTLYANQVAFEFSGLTTEEVDRAGFMESACHPDELGRVLQRRRVGMSEGVPFETETRVLFKRTQYRWVLVQYNPLKDEEGQAIRWYATATDIDDRKKAEEALRSSERTLNQMINAIPCWSDVFSSDGAVLYRNQTVSDYTGFPLEEVRKEDFRARVFHPEDLVGPEELRLALARPVPFENEQRVLTKDGGYRWFLFRYKPLLDEQGRIERWYSAGFDIDDRKRAEAEVEQAYLRLAEAQRLSKTGSFITDLMADRHDWSEETYRIFEFDPAAKVSVQMIRDLVHPEDLPSFDAVIARGMTGMDVDFVFRIVTSRGALKHIRGMARILSQSHGHPLFIGALQDVTAAKVAEEALDRARSELAHVSRVTTLNALTGSIAHEINQPLSGIITNGGTCLRMLDSDPPNVGGAREIVRRILRDGNRAADVISRLRALFSKKEFALEPLDLNEVTREVVSLSLSDLQRNRIALRSQFAEEIPSVVGDRVQLQQVILNLLKNASDAMSEVNDRPRDLLVSTMREGNDHVRLSVRDTGTGVRPDDLKRLFDPFFTTKSGGMGIGLSVSRSIVDRHHGRLWAEANDGPGATFSFSIPCNVAADGQL